MKKAIDCFRYLYRFKKIRVWSMLGIVSFVLMIYSLNIEACAVEKNKSTNVETQVINLLAEYRENKNLVPHTVDEVLSEQADIIAKYYFENPDKDFIGSGIETDFAKKCFYTYKINYTADKKTAKNIVKEITSVNTLCAYFDTEMPIYYAIGSYRENEKNTFVLIWYTELQRTDRVNFFNDAAYII